MIFCKKYSRIWIANCQISHQRKIVHDPQVRFWDDVNLLHLYFIKISKILHSCNIKICMAETHWMINFFICTIRPMVYDSELMYDKLMILPKISFMTLRYRNCRYNSITENFILSSILIYWYWIQYWYMGHQKLLMLIITPQTVKFSLRGE